MSGTRDDTNYRAKDEKEASLEGAPESGERERLKKREDGYKCKISYLYINYTLYERVQIFCVD